MSCFKLGVPGDIPWRRICVSEDMLDPDPCDLTRPPRWHASLAAFRFDPDEDYQPYEDMVVSYVKVVATMAPYVPRPGIAIEKGFPWDISEGVEQAIPCYGAILQVTVGPRKDEASRFSANQYPYFLDFEPKKRELYELVTDTGEVLSSSADLMSIGKSGTNFHTLEHRNLDRGFAFGLSAKVGGSGGGLNLGENKEVGTISQTGEQNTNIRTIDSSTERRELQSHVSYLTQMYSLFQAYHLGTNRAVFFIEPRPHQRQAEATFINGPRALEGIQEVVLVVARPREMRDFCVGVLLETQHVDISAAYETPTTKAQLAFRLYAEAENRDNDWGVSNIWQPVEKTETYTAPPGWEIDTSKGDGGYGSEVLRQQNVVFGPKFLVTPDQLTITAEVQWHFWETKYAHNDRYEDGFLDIDVTIYLKRSEPVLVGQARTSFLDAHQLCCCPAEEPARPKKLPHWISDEANLAKLKMQFYRGPSSHRALMESRQIAAALRDVLSRSLASSRRYQAQSVAYEDSDSYFYRVADVARSAGYASVRERVANWPVLEGDERERVASFDPDLTFGKLLATPSFELAGRLGASKDRVLSLKQQALAFIFRPTKHEPRS